MKRRMMKSIAVLMCLMTAVAFMPTFAFATEAEDQDASVIAEEVTPDVAEEEAQEDGDAAQEDQESQEGQEEPVVVAPKTAAPGDGGAPAKTVKAKVNFTAQNEGAFLCGPQFGVEVDSGLAESYGYKDDVPADKNVSAIDVLVKATEIIFGDAFTAEDKDTYLSVPATGFVSTIFGEETSANGFLVNGATPNDGTMNDYGYNGTTVINQPVKSGDSVDFYTYKDRSDYLDNLAWFEKDGEEVDTIRAVAGTQLGITVKGICIGWYGGSYKDREDLHKANAVRPLEFAQLAWVNVETGEKEDITETDGFCTYGVDTDSYGKASIRIPDKAGNYYLTAYMTDEKITEHDQTPIIMSLQKIVVTGEAEAIVGDASKKATSKLIDEVNLSKYRSQELIKVYKTLLDGIALINTAKTVEEVDMAYNKTIEEIGKILTAAEYNKQAAKKVTGFTVKSGKAKATLKWTKKTSTFQGYKIAYKMSGKSWKTTTTTAGSKTIKKLKSGKKYSFKVRGYKTVKGVKIYGPWTSAKTVRIK